MEPEPNSVLWPQFDLPETVSVHALAVEDGDSRLGTVVVVDGLDVDEHVDAMFADEVELITDVTSAGTTMTWRTLPVQATWRHLGTPWWRR